jgi:ABC-type transport system involved in cytochrome bd biosynthesis fused ATPase/permease subunit
MAIPLNKTPQSSYSERALRELELEHNRDREERITGWTVIWVLFAFKMATVALIWWAANGSREEGAEVEGLLAATTWYYLVVPIVALSGFIGYRIRLRAARKRVEELRRAEFMEARQVAESATITVELTDEEKVRLRALDDRREDVA